MENTEIPLCESTCICGQGKFKVFYRTFDKSEAIEHLWEIDCSHCRGIYDIEKRGNLIGVVKKSEEAVWEKEVKQMGKVKSKRLFHKPKFIRIIFDVDKVGHHVA